MARLSDGGESAKAGRQMQLVCAAQEVAARVLGRLGAAVPALEQAQRTGPREGPGASDPPPFSDNELARAEAALEVCACLDAGGWFVGRKERDRKRFFFCDECRTCR